MMTTEATPDFQYTQMVWLVGDVVSYKGRTYTISHTLPSVHGVVYVLKAPYTVRIGPARFTIRWTWAATCNLNGELS